MAPILRFFKDDLAWKRLTTTDDDDPLRSQRIRCPKCRWKPTPASVWCCGEGGPEPPFGACGTVWNTFLTHGRCPGCGHQWIWTSCLRCGGWSLHEEWYGGDE